jgi:hypothetical protein
MLHTLYEPPAQETAKKTLTIINSDSPTKPIAKYIRVQKQKVLQRGLLLE